MKIAKISSALDSFIAKICVTITVTITNITNALREKKCNAEDITKNQRENPNVTAKALNLGEDNSMFRSDKEALPSLFVQVQLLQLMQAIEKLLETCKTFF